MCSNLKFIEKYNLESVAPKLFFTSGKGAVLWTDEGQEYLNMNEMSVCLGENNVAFNRTVTEAMSGLMSQKGAGSVWKERLLARMDETTGGAFKKIHFTASGSEANEWALKFARKLTGRTEILSFWNSIHGRTDLSAAVSGLPKRKTGYGPLTGTAFFPFPLTSCWPQDAAGQDWFDALEEKLKFETAQDLAAVIVEPMQGADNRYTPPGFLASLRKWTEKRGVILILDEVQSGMGRTGVLYRCLSEGVIPDIMVLGKALGNGFHIAAALFRETPDKTDCFAAMGGSGDSPVCCAAACCVFDQLLAGGLLEYVKVLGYNIKSRLEAMKQRHSFINEIRGEGAAFAVVFDSAERAAHIRGEMRRRGVLLGNFGPALLIKSVYTMTEEQVIGAMDALEKVFKST